jgi:hypothetical protein
VALGKAALSVAVAAFAAAFCAAVAGLAVDPGGGVVYDLVAAAFVLGLLAQVYLQPLLLGATAAACAAARRGRSPLPVLRLGLLAGAPFVWLVLSLALPQVVVLTYLAVLYGVAYARLRRLLDPGRA